MAISLNVWGASMSTSNHWPAVCACPVLQRVASLPSSAFAAAPPPLAEADAAQPVRESAVSPEPIELEPQLCGAVTYCWPSAVSWPEEPRRLIQGDDVDRPVNQA